MQWMNPVGAWAFSALAVILFLYILKQKTEPISVSSTYLWQKALTSAEADRPIQRLRRSLLLLVQLLVALLFALSLMRPMTTGGEATETVFVFDISASMQATDGGRSRLQNAVADARRRIDGMPDGARVSILTAGAAASQTLARSSDLMAARRALDAIAPQNGGADLDGALSLAFALRKELPDLDLVVYTDQRLPAGPYAQPSVGPGLDNRAIVSLRAGATAAVARVANFGAEATVTVECSADGELCDIRTVTVAEGEILSVQFDLPREAALVTARIEEPDALMPDNERAWTKRDSGSTTVVLAGRDNIFVEKALALRPDVVIRKTTLSEVASVGGGALTVIDGPLPEALPEKGALLLIDPDVRVEAQRDKPASLAPASGPLSDTLGAYVQLDEAQVARYKPVPVGTPVWLANGEPVLTVDEETGRRVAVLGFDLHNSNLPLLKDFPIFMQNLLSYLAPEPLGAGFEDGDCGVLMVITPQSFARTADVITPKGRKAAIPLSGGVLSDTDEIGVYRLRQTDDSGRETDIPFTLHIPAAESDVRTVAAGTEAAEHARGNRYGREWTPFLLGLLLLLTLVEWWVYRRGY